MMNTPLYSVGTWDTDKQAYTPQRGLSVPSFNITLAQLRVERVARNWLYSSQEKRRRWVLRRQRLLGAGRTNGRYVLERNSEELESVNYFFRENRT